MWHSEDEFVLLPIRDDVIALPKQMRVAQRNVHIEHGVTVSEIDSVMLLLMHDHVFK